LCSPNRRRNDLGGLPPCPRPLSTCSNGIGQDWPPRGLPPSSGSRGPTVTTSCSHASRHADRPAERTPGVLSARRARWTGRLDASHTQATRRGVSMVSAVTAPRYYTAGSRPLARNVRNALTCALSVGLAVCWFRTSRTGVSRHAGLMSPEIPE
jgi:hypothetical protein